jgi:transcriptional regulator with XRE-family HTH domain
MTDFRTYVKACRERAKKTTEDLAELCGYNGTMITHIEKGRRLPSYEHAKLLAAGLGVAWQEFSPKFDAAIRARDTKKYMKDLEKFYQQRFDGKKTSDPFLQEMLSSFKFPQELMEIEARAERVGTFTPNFWADVKSCGLEPEEQTEEIRPYTAQFAQMVQENFKRGVEYHYFYPADIPSIERPLQLVQQFHQDLGSQKTWFYAVSGPLQEFIFAGYELVFYFDPHLETRQDLQYNIGFYIDKLGLESPFRLILHERISEKHLERYNNAIQHMIQALTPSK